MSAVRPRRILARRAPARGRAGRRPSAASSRGARTSANWRRGIGVAAEPGRARWRRRSGPRPCRGPRAKARSNAATARVWLPAVAAARPTSSSSAGVSGAKALSSSAMASRTSAGLRRAATSAARSRRTTARGRAVGARGRAGAGAPWRARRARRSARPRPSRSPVPRVGGGLAPADPVARERIGRPGRRAARARGCRR